MHDRTHSVDLIALGSRSELFEPSITQTTPADHEGAVMQMYHHHRLLAGLATRLTRGGWLEDVRADGSQIRFMISDGVCGDSGAEQESPRA